MFYNRL